MNTAPVEAVGESAPELWASLLSSAAMLFIVLAVLVGVLLLMKRLANQRGGLTEKGMMKTLATMPVAPKQRIALVEVLGEKYLIGISPQSITHIARIESEIEPQPPAPRRPESYFLSLLKRKSDPPPNDEPDNAK